MDIMFFFYGLFVLVELDLNCKYLHSVYTVSFFCLLAESLSTIRMKLPLMKMHSVHLLTKTMMTSSLVPEQAIAPTAIPENI